MVMALVSVLAGYGLEDNHLLYSVRILSQSGIPNPKNLEKIKLLPETLKLTGLEAILAASLVIFFHRELNEKWSRISKQLSSRQILLLFFFVLYLTITFLMLNFGTVGLCKRIRAVGRMNNQEIVAADYGKDYLLVRTLRTRTPQNANILIQTKNDIKYLLNYDLYPRRFFFYPDSETLAAGIPEKWKDRYQITWILEVDDHDSSKFILIERRIGSSMTKTGATTSAIFDGES